MEHVSLTDGELITVDKVVERNRVNENGGREGGIE